MSRQWGGGHPPYQFRPKRPRHDGPTNYGGSSGLPETGWGSWPQSTNRPDRQGYGGFQNGPYREAPGQQYQRGTPIPNVAEEPMSTGMKVRASIQAKIQESQELIQSLSKLKDLFDETDGAARAAGISLDSLTKGNLLLGGSEQGGRGRESRGPPNHDQRGELWEEGSNSWEGGSGYRDEGSGYRDEGSGYRDEGSGYWEENESGLWDGGEGSNWEGSSNHPYNWRMHPGPPDPDQGFGHQARRFERNGAHSRGFHRGRGGGRGPDFAPRGYPNQGFRGLLGQGPPGFVGNRGLMGPQAFQRFPGFQGPRRPQGPIWRGAGPRRAEPPLPYYSKVKSTKGPTPRKDDWPNKHLEKETPTKKKIPLKTAFRNLVDELTSFRNAGPVSIEQFDSAVYQQKVGLWIGTVVKKMKDAATNFWWHTCDIYINSIFISSAKDRLRSDVKKAAYNEALKIFKNTSVDDIVDNKEIVSFDEMKKKADFVETPFKVYDSNYSNVMIKRDTDDPIPISEFIMLEPISAIPQVSAGETIATGILRQSADFTKMVLSFETRPAPSSGSICAIYLEGQFLGEAFGTSKLIAKKAASKIVLEKLQKTNYTLLLKKDGRKTIPALQDVVGDFGHPDLNTEEERKDYREKLVESFKKRFQEAELTELAIPMAGVTQNEKFNIIGAAKQCDLVAEVRVQIGDDANGKPLYERWYKKEDPKDKQYLVISRNPRGKQLLDLLKKYGENHHYKLKYPTNEPKQDDTAVKEGEVKMEEETVIGEANEQRGEENVETVKSEPVMEEEAVMEHEDSMEEEGAMEEDGEMEEDRAMTEEEGAMEEEQGQKEEGSNGLGMESC